MHRFDRLQHWLLPLTLLAGCEITSEGLGPSGETEVDFVIAHDGGSTAMLPAPAADDPTSSADPDAALAVRDAASGRDAAPEAAVDAAGSSPADAQSGSNECAGGGIHALRIDAELSASARAIGLRPAITSYGVMKLFALVDGADGEASLRACGATMPPLTSTSTVTVGSFEDALWEAIDARWSGTFTLACDAPGCALTSDYLEPQLGIALPARAPWPAALTPLDRTRLRDDDHDGVLGVPLQVREEGVDLPGKGAGRSKATDLRAAHMALRVGLRLDGSLDDCTYASGQASEMRVDARVLGCTLQSGASCRLDQVEALDGALPAWNVVSAKWRMVRIDDRAGCAEVRAAFP